MTLTKGVLDRRAADGHQQNKSIPLLLAITITHWEMYNNISYVIMINDNAMLAKMVNDITKLEDMKRYPSSGGT